MPELPEVETIKRGLQRVVVGKKIEKFENKDSKVVQFDPKEIEGLHVVEIERRAKILVFKLSKEKGPFDSAQGFDGTKVFLCHLKMTGQLIWEECMGETEFCLKKKRGAKVAGGHPSPDWVAKLPNAYTRAIFHFDDRSVLFFNDLRRFGYMKLYDLDAVNPAKAGIYSLDPRVKPEDDRLREIKELKNLGPEPFSKDFTIEYMANRAKRIPTRKIKQFITDQEIISGVGNIYVDEALFYSKIMPTRAVKDLSPSEWGSIRDNIRKALDLGIKYGGSSEDTYVDAFGNQGTMGEHAKVYRRTGKPCANNCGGTVGRIALGGRGTHFCPICQQ